MNMPLSKTAMNSSQKPWLLDYISGQLLITAIYTSAEPANIDLGMSWYLDFDHTLVIFVRREKVYLIYHSLNIVAHGNMML